MDRLTIEDDDAYLDAVFIQGDEANAPKVNIGIGEDHDGVSIDIQAGGLVRLRDWLTAAILECESEKNLPGGTSL